MLKDTIVALSTPRGESALALIRLSGPLCIYFSETLFKLTLPIQPRHTYLNTYRNLRDEAVDEVVWVFYPAGASFTVDAMLELACHGNPLIIEAIVEDLIARGCRLAEPGEFTKTAFLNNRIDLSQAEAIGDLIHAKNERALRVAKKQLGGALSKKISQLMDQLLEAIAQLEVYIDFSEEDLPEANFQPLVHSLEGLKGECSALLDSHRYRKPLVSGLQVTLLGAPNAGKSTLFNALLGAERALVSHEAGTTRDYIQAPLTIGPYAVYLNDTAGLRETDHPIEKAGIAKTLERAEESDFFLWLIDRSAPLPCLDASWLEQLRPHNTLIVKTKTDLPPYAIEEDKSLDAYPCLHLCLHDKKAVEELKHSLERLIQKSELLPSEDTLIINARHAQALRSCQAYLDATLDLFESNAPLELRVSELRLALDALGDILGKVDNEAMLDKLFSSFCIGK